MAKINIFDSIEKLNKENLYGKNIYIDMKNIINCDNFLEEILLGLGFEKNPNNSEILVGSLLSINEHEINIIAYNHSSFLKNIEEHYETSDVFYDEMIKHLEKQELLNNKTIAVYFIKGDKEVLSETEKIYSELANIKNIIKNNNNNISFIKDKFEIEIVNNKSKDKIIDELHKEVTQYKNGLVEKLIEGMALDIIQLIDSINKNSKIYESKEFTQENYNKLLTLFNSISDDLNDILYRQNIEPYTIDGDNVDIKKQKIVQITDTDDESKHNKISERVSCGYESDRKVLRPERIKIYKFKNNKGVE